jgi:hypothetical protein
MQSRLAMIKSNPVLDLNKYKLVLEEPDHLSDITSWQGHIPFAFFIVQAAAPRLLVELGTHKGDSYCAFCQAISRLGSDCRCFAVDSWEGDAQAGFYGEEVLAELRRYHDGRYARFSRLIRSTFDQAVESFSDGTIDILHVDGCHRYEAAKHDFYKWLRKMSPRGVVLLHDINVKESDFGVYRLWEELTTQYETFEFEHAHGLGVLFAGVEMPSELQPLFRVEGSEKGEIQRLFCALGENILFRHHFAEMAEAISQTGLEDNKHREIIAEISAKIRTLEKQISRTFRFRNFT